MATNALTKTIKIAGGKISKNSTTILTVIAVAGTISTGVLAYRAGTKAEKLIKGEKLTKKEYLQTTWKLYIPVVLSGALTIAAVIGSNRIHVKRNAALAGAYAIANKTLEEYQKKIIQTIGESKERKVRDEIKQDKVTATPPQEGNIIVTGNGEVICMETYFNQYFKSDVEQIRRAVNEINAELLNSNYVSLNDFYYALGIPETKGGYDLGWHMQDGLIEIDIGACLTDKGDPCVTVDYRVKPKQIYNS